MNSNLNEAKRWLKQAQADLSVAQWDFTGKFWWEVCFKCQQAVEKALKSYCYAKGRRAVLGHSLLELGQVCARYDKEFSGFVPTFRKLDKYYLITRYPNGLPGLTPAEYFDEEEAARALAQAKEILDFVTLKLKALEK